MERIRLQLHELPAAVRDFLTAIPAGAEVQIEEPEGKIQFAIHSSLDRSSETLAMHVRTNERP